MSQKCIIYSKSNFYGPHMYHFGLNYIFLIHKKHTKKCEKNNLTFFIQSENTNRRITFDKKPQGCGEDS